MNVDCQLRVSKLLNSSTPDREHAHAETRNAHRSTLETSASSYTVYKREAITFRGPTDWDWDWNSNWKWSWNALPVGMSCVLLRQFTSLVRMRSCGHCSMSLRDPLLRSFFRTRRTRTMSLWTRIFLPPAGNSSKLNSCFDEGDTRPTKVCSGLSSVNQNSFQVGSLTSDLAALQKQQQQHRLRKLVPVHLQQDICLQHVYDDWWRGDAPGTPRSASGNTRVRISFRQ